MRRGDRARSETGPGVDGVLLYRTWNNIPRDVPDCGFWHVASAALPRTVVVATLRLRTTRNPASQAERRPERPSQWVGIEDPQRCAGDPLYSPCCVRQWPYCRSAAGPAR